MSHTALVLAAQHGDHRARDELISQYLPVVYTVVGRAFGRHPDVDDVVQETLLRAVRDLATLRDPSRFRSWLVAIAMHQISSHRHKLAIGGRVIDLDETVTPSPATSVEDFVILRRQLSDQRRQIAEAIGWMDAEQRIPLSLWWQENAGQVTRREVAAALGLSVAHAGVRLQRMRDQLETCRAIVAALAAEPRCRRLATRIADWDGRPTRLWRKRLGQHIWHCPACCATASGHMPLEALLGRQSVETVVPSIEPGGGHRGRPHAG